MSNRAIRRKGWSRKTRRLAIVAALAGVIGIAVALVLTALRDQIVFFYTPSDIAERGIEPGIHIRLGGLVELGTWKREGQVNGFAITDGDATIQATYVGVLPDLFREGQGVVAEGRLLPGLRFEATNVLAKHDENYLPKEVVEALKESGEWRDE